MNSRRPASARDYQRRAGAEILAGRAECLLMTTSELKDDRLDSWPSTATSRSSPASGPAPNRCSDTTGWPATRPSRASSQPR